MQEIFNPNDDGTKKEVKGAEFAYRVHDKVLHLVNVPEDNVFNGDFGEITAIIDGKDTDSKQDELVIDFEGVEVSLPRNDWNRITLAYATSIHKSQGSEFKMVLLPMVKQYHRMLERNLLYTAITRAKDLLILLGEPQAFETAVHSRGDLRDTCLVERITMTERFSAAGDEAEIVKENVAAVDENLVPEKNHPTENNYEQSNQNLALVSETPDPADFVLTKEKILSLSISPMIGMEDISPYDFLENK
jgi:exodeoxyribonuclease V alpha subunit